MFCIKVSLYRLAVVSKCYRDSLMECEKFTFKKTGNPRLQVGGNGHCCEQYGYYIAFNQKTAMQF